MNLLKIAHISYTVTAQITRVKFKKKKSPKNITQREIDMHTVIFMSHVCNYMSIRRQKKNIYTLAKGNN